MNWNFVTGQPAGRPAGHQERGRDLTLRAPTVPAWLIEAELQKYRAGVTAALVAPEL